VIKVPKQQTPGVFPRRLGDTHLPLVTGTDARFPPPPGQHPCPEQRIELASDQRVASRRPLIAASTC
jgi:hypothetical protein